MSIQRVSAERFASLYHHYHGVLAPDFNCAEAQAPAWTEIPENERSRIIAAMRLALLDLGYGNGAMTDEQNNYFAKPGEAEWGC